MPSLTTIQHYDHPVKIVLVVLTFKTFTMSCGQDNQCPVIVICKIHIWLLKRKINGKADSCNPMMSHLMTSGTDVSPAQLHVLLNDCCLVTDLPIPIVVI